MTKVGRNVYCFKDVWDERDARHRIRDAVLDNPQLGSSIHVSKLSLSGRSLRPVLMRAVTAFVQSFEVGCSRDLDFVLDEMVHQVQAGRHRHLIAPGVFRRKAYVCIPIV